MTHVTGCAKKDLRPRCEAEEDWGGGRATPRGAEKAQAALRPIGLALGAKDGRRAL